MNGRTVAIAAVLVAIVLLSIRLFLVWRGGQVVETRGVYEVPEPREFQTEQSTALQSTPNDRLDSQSFSYQSDKSNSSLDDNSDLRIKRRIQELEAAAAQKQLIIDELREYKANAEAEKKAGEALLAEAREAADWISDWSTRTEPLYAEVAFILLDPTIENQEDFKRMFPDLDERAYYAEKLAETEKATDEFVERLALLSEPLRSGVLDRIRTKWTSVAGEDAVDAFIEQVNDKI